MFLVRFILLGLVINFGSSMAVAQNPPPGPYTLMMFENSHFRDWTFDELKSKISIHQDAIDLNTCNGNEKLLLPDLVKSNPKNNSLRILNATNAQVLTYIDGVLYNSVGKKVSVSSISDSYTKTIIKFLEQLRQFPESKRLISLMQKGLYPLTFAKTGGPRFEFVGNTGKPNSGYDEAPIMQHFAALRKSAETDVNFKQFGAGGFIRLDPNIKNLMNIESDNVKRGSPILAAFAHEMFHAFDSVRGLLDRRSVEGEGMEFMEVTEYRAVYFENVIRKNLGRKYRKYYGSVDLTNPAQAKDTMLDKNGQPYLLPTPCLK
jgi:Effector protein